MPLGRGSGPSRPSRASAALLTRGGVGGRGRVRWRAPDPGQWPVVAGPPPREELQSLLLLRPVNHVGPRHAGSSVEPATFPPDVEAIKLAGEPVQGPDLLWRLPGGVPS